MANFKNALPSDNCPEKEVENIEDNRKYYRRTKNKPPTSDDFIPTWFINPRNMNECKEKGVSISENYSDAVALKQFPQLGKYIYSGIIYYEIHGIVKNTPSSTNPSHRTWYPYEGINEADIFNEEE